MDTINHNNNNNNSHVDKHHGYRRLSGDVETSPSGTEVLGLQRTRSVRASFRRLGARWKTPSTTATKTSAPKTSCVEPLVPKDSVNSIQLQHKQLNEVIDKQLTPGPLGGKSKSRFDKPHLSYYKHDNFGRTKKVKQLKRIGSSGGLRGSKENWWPTEMPANVPSKAAAILEIPVNAAQFNRDTSAWLMNNHTTSTTSLVPSELYGNGGQFRFLKRSVSLNEEARKKAEATEGKPRTATIRRGSVWANSTLSKSRIHAFFFCYHLYLFIPYLHYYIYLSCFFFLFLTRLLFAFFIYLLRTHPARPRHQTHINSIEKR